MLLTRLMRGGRGLLAVLLAIATLGLTMGAADTAARYNTLSHQMMCTCGCAQLLGECNHVGCPNSPGMLKTLSADVASGMADHEVLVDFAHKYGPTSLASPLLTRFNEAAWVVPPAILMLALLAALLLVRRWKEKRLFAAVPTAPLSPHQAEVLSRVRRESEGL